MSVIFVKLIFIKFFVVMSEKSFEKENKQDAPLTFPELKRSVGVRWSVNWKFTPYCMYSML